MQLSDIAGVSFQAVSQWENGKKSPGLDSVIKICNYFNFDINAFVDAEKDYEDSIVPRMPDNITPMPKTHKVPRLGVIACGEPILAEQNIECYDAVPDYIKCDFTLVCKGDSMINARIYDGDIVCIRRQPVVENGEIAAVLIDDEATLKRVYIYADKIILQPENPAYPPFVYIGEEMNNVRILGKATHFISAVR